MNFSRFFLLTMTGIFVSQLALATVTTPNASVSNSGLNINSGSTSDLNLYPATSALASKPLPEDAMSVQREDNATLGYRETGYIIGTPVSGVERPHMLYTFHSYDVEIKVGDYPQDPNYIGTTMKVSIGRERTDLIRKFQAIQNNTARNYVFKFTKAYHSSVIPLGQAAVIIGTPWFVWLPALMVPEDEPIFTYGSKYFITDIRNSKTPDMFMKAQLPVKVSAEEINTGINGTGTKRARITKVSRAGYFFKRCYVTLNYSGLSEHGETSHNETFAVRSENLCRYSEELLMGQAVIDATFADRFWAPTDGTKGIINSLAFVKQDPAQVATSGPNSQSSDDALLARLQDPNFRQKFQDALNKPTGTVKQ